MLSRTLVKNRSRRSATGSRWSTPTQKHRVVKGFDADERIGSAMAPGGRAPPPKEGDPMAQLVRLPSERDEKGDPMAKLVRLPSERGDMAEGKLPGVGGRRGIIGRMRKRWGAK